MDSESMSISSDDPLSAYLRDMIHAINNPIGVILGTTQFTLSGIEQKTLETLEVSDLNEVIESLQVIERQTRCCAQLIQDIRSLVLARPRTLQSLDLNECVRGAVEQIYRSEAEINVEEEFESGLLEVYGDRMKLEEAFGAIARNAFEAMPNGGHFHYSTRRGESGIDITFKDNGIGISEENLSKIFEPMFSKKPETKHGLGLPVAHLILEFHGAKINVDSIEKEGTTVTVTFPVSLKEQNSDGVQYGK